MKYKNNITNCRMYNNINKNTNYSKDDGLLI